MAKDRASQGTSSGSDRAFMTLKFGDSPPVDVPVKCCLCRAQVRHDGWCDACNRWPINCTPIRRDEAGHAVGVSGWCATCNAFRDTVLEPEECEWVDTGITAKMLGRMVNQRKAAELSAILSGPGWPEKEVPMHEAHLPRSWRNRELKAVGKTKLGYTILFPAEQCPAGKAFDSGRWVDDASDVPF
jgi:hypothetical protein